MKKALFLTLFCCVHILSQSQNWQALHLGDTLNYLNESNMEISSIWIDSMNIDQNDTLYYLNQTQNWHLLQRQFTEHPNFLLKQTGLTNDGTLFFRDDTISYHLKPNTSLFEPFMFDSLQNITAELILISDSILFGSQDSLKFFLLSNGDSIILSKNNGILKFPSYYAYNNPLHDTSYTFNSTADKHTLIGKENETIGKQIPQKNDFFNYETNDILQYYIVDGDYGFHYTSEQRILKTITIIDNISNNNEEMYTADIHEFSYKYWVDYMFIDHFIDSMEISYQDTLFCRPSKYNLDSYTGQNNYYSLDTNRQYYSSKVSYNNHFKGIMKSYNDDLYALYYNLNSMSFEIVNSNIHLTNTSHFVENIGLVEKHYGFNDETPQESSSINTSLMGFVHNGDTIGSIDFPLFAPSLDYLPNLKVYPNPTNDIVYIQFGNTKSMDCIIQLRDQLGRVLKSEEYINIYSDKTYSLDLSHYHSGFYILEIRNIKGNQVNSWKVMKR